MLTLMNQRLSFDNTFQRLPKLFYEHVRPTPIKGAKHIISSAPTFKDLGLDPKLSQDPDHYWIQWLNGEVEMPGEQRIATRYAGHQFGVWAGQLGDGRAISLGEILTPNSAKRLEIQTKGSGLTPFSRMGDGKAVIRSSVREFLCSEAMWALNIPTTRSATLLIGDDPVYREDIERSALLARVFETNIRFGHFELCHRFNKHQELKELYEYTLTTFFPDIANKEDSEILFFQEVFERTIKLVAQWQDVGFCHGVINTDNMSIVGETIDYGPFGFLEETNFGHICNHSDFSGRYAYNEQPSIVWWNLEKLAQALSPLFSKDQNLKIQETLKTFPSRFEFHYRKLCQKKLGLYSSEDADYPLFVKLLKNLHKEKVDYTCFFRWLSRYEKGNIQSLDPFFDHYHKESTICEWLKDYDQRLEREKLSESDRQEKMLANNPKFILRNYIAQEIIESVEQDNKELIKQALHLFHHPYEEHPEFSRWALPTPTDKQGIIVSCSS